MPQIDRCHTQVENALKKAGWTLIHPPQTLYIEFRYLLVDIEARREQNGTQKHILFAEVKCFRQNTTNELFTAIGQYIIYQASLDSENDATPLYLAIPKTAYDTIFTKTIRAAIQQHRIKLLVVDLEKEEISQWIE
jgi:hypothetical protein